MHVTTNHRKCYSKLTNEFHIEIVTWTDCQSELRNVREQVFVREQNVPIELEWDGFDETATHLLVIHKKIPIACARILNYQVIGRMAVLKSYRGFGLGFKILLKAIEICKLYNTQLITLSAQVHAVRFYEKAGFLVCSEPYIDANIFHVDMQLELGFW